MDFYIENMFRIVNNEEDLLRAYSQSTARLTTVGVLNFMIKTVGVNAFLSDN